MKLIRQLLRALRIVRSVHKGEMVEKWTGVDAETLAAFLRSDTGLKFGATLRHLTFSDANAAVTAPAEMLTWRCGHAAGMQCLCGQIDLLARHTQESDTPTTGPTDDLRWLHEHTNTKRT